MPAGLPDRAQVVVVGGGVIGVSIAYHLTKLGWSDVLLLERHALTSGTTWHAAGLITSAGMTDDAALFMSIHSRELYARLEEETGLSTGFRRCGHLHVATIPERVESLRREAAYAKRFGQESHELGPAEVAELWPLADTSDLLRGFYVPIEGRADPHDVAMSLARGARMGGATIVEGVPVTGISTNARGDRVTGVRTAEGDVEAETVVLAAGVWSRQLGDAIGVCVPLQAAEHYYLITEPFGVAADLPVLEDPSTYGYYREETGGLLVGLFEPDARAWRLDGIPDDFAFGELEPDWERVSPFVDKAMARVPALEKVGVRKFFCGPESFTSDVHPLLGETPEIRGLFTATGLNSLGILLGGGVGAVMADWIVNGRPPAIDLTGFTTDRTATHEVTRRFREERTVEQLGVLFGDAYAPGWTPATARGVRRSPVHERLVRHGARFDTTTGWEWADFFAGEGRPVPEVAQSWGRQPHWSLVEEEHRAVREAVGLLDMSFMCKFLLEGRDAAAVLHRLVVSDVLGAPVGKVTYTAICHEGGGMWCDCTFTRLSHDRFLVVGTDLVARRLEALLRRAVGEDEAATVTDVTAGFALFSLQGPRSRELLSALSSADLSNEAFRYLTGRSIDVAYAAPVWAQRVTYVGELGFELHVRADMALSVYDALFEQGGALGLRDVGMSALNGLRLEKGYRDYGHDIGNDDTPLSAGIGFVLDWEKGDFPGREALVKERDAGPLPERLVNLLLLEPEPLLWELEDVLCDGELVGEVEAGAYGYTLGGAVAIATVRHDEGVTPAWLSSGRFEVVVNGRRAPARVQFAPLYDPKRERILS